MQSPLYLRSCQKSFAIIGGGEYEQPLRELVSSLSLEKYVQFMGWQSDQGHTKRNYKIRYSFWLLICQSERYDNYYADPKDKNVSIVAYRY